MKTNKLKKNIRMFLSSEEGKMLDSDIVKTGLALGIYLQARLKLALARSRGELARCRKELDGLRAQAAAKGA